MKRIKFNLAIAAMVLGSGAALATTSHKKFTAPNYFNNAGTSSSPNWVPLTRTLGTIEDPGTYRCDAASNICTAYFSSPPPAHQVPSSDFTSGKYMVN